MRGRARLLLLLLAGAILLAGPAAANPMFAEATLAELFRLQWEATPGVAGVAIGGYVQNVGNVSVERMRLVVDRLDQSGAVVGTTITYVMGAVSANQRTYFTTRVPAAVAYKVRVLSFDWMNCRD